VLRIHSLQLPGKRALSAAEFLNARDLTGVQLD
jgi:methionyl-tRNA formyltransferase